MRVKRGFALLFDWTANDMIKLRRKQMIEELPKFLKLMKLLKSMQVKRGKGSR